MENKEKLKAIKSKFEAGLFLDIGEIHAIIEEMDRANLEVQELKRREKETEEFWKNFYQKKADKIGRRLGVEIKL